MKKRFLWILIVFVMTKLYAQSYIDLSFASSNGVLPQTIQVTNLTKGINITIKGSDILRLNTKPSSLQSVDVGSNVLLVYPNPLIQKGYFSFTNPIHGKVEIQLHSLNGKLIYNKSYELLSGEHVFSISDVPHGTQLLTVTTQSGSYSGKINSSGNIATQVITAPSEQNDFLNQNTTPVINRVNSTNPIVELSYSIGDTLHLLANLQGYVSQGIYTTPTISQTITFFLSQIVEISNPTTGRIWMDRNLGATRVATSRTDIESYGDLYQWGRGADGHEKRTSPVISTLSSSDTPGHGNYIDNSASPFDWRNTQNNNLWQGINGINNPCPNGFRIPTAAEWDAEISSWTSYDPIGAYESVLKLPSAGYRFTKGAIYVVGSYGLYWSSTVSGIYARNLLLYYKSALVYSNSRAGGFSVRCIKD